MPDGVGSEVSVFMPYKRYRESAMARYEQKTREHELEARLIEEGLRDLSNGHYIDDADLDAWLDGLVDDPDLEIPLANRRTSTPRP